MFLSRGQNNQNTIDFGVKTTDSDKLIALMGHHAVPN
jgi:hypothetical protein